MVNCSIWNNGFEENRYFYVEGWFGRDRELIYSPPTLDEAWMDEPEWRSWKLKTITSMEYKWIDGALKIYG